MKRFLCTLVGLALCTAAVVALCSALYELARTGTCASGGPYVSARPCPPGTGATMLLIPGAIVAGLAGIALYAAGGMARRAPASPIPLAIWMWAFLFLGAAGSTALAAFGPGATGHDDPGVRMAAIVLLVLFVPMAIVPLIVSLRSGRKQAAPRRPAIRIGPPGIAAAGAFGMPSRPSAPTAPPASGDVVSRLERLAALRAAGAITPAEYDRLKADLLA